jgi:hypothetical protein
MGTLTKQTAGTTMLPVLWRAWKDRRWVGILTVLASFMVPIVVTAALVGFGDFFFWVFTGNGGYLTSLGPWTTIMARAWANIGIFAGANAAAVLAIAYMTWRGGIRKADADLWLWLAGAVIGATSGFHFFGHYFLQLLPPIVILATGALARNGSRLRWTMLTTSVVSATLFLVLAFRWPSSAQERNNEIAQKVQSYTMGEPNAPILVWGMNPEIYFMADRPPASRYITSGFLTGFSGGGNNTDVGEGFGVPGTLPNLANDFFDMGHPLFEKIPRVIVDDSEGKAYAPEFNPTIADLLKCYDLRSTVPLKGSPGTKIYSITSSGWDCVKSWASEVQKDAFLHPPKDNP